MTRAEPILPIGLMPITQPPRTQAAEVPSGRGRKIEDWIVGTLGDDGAASASEDWQDVIGRIAPRRRPDDPKGKSQGGWGRFRLIGRKGITVVSLTDRSLTKEQELTELAGDLLAVVEGGRHRLVLNFASVERLSSWAVAAVAEASRKCRAVQGGMLKVCGLRPQVISVFGITSLDKEIKIYADENAAIDSPWPETPEVLPLPVDVLACLGRLGARRGVEGENGDATDDTEEFTAMSGAWLSAEAGPSRGRMVAVDASEFLIGRDACCHLRLDSSTVSRRHASIEVWGDRLFLQDLGSTNGTFLNGLPVRGESSEIRDGDWIRVGAIGLKFTAGPAGRCGNIDGVEEMVAAWLQDDDRAGFALDREATPTEEIVIPAGVDGKVRHKCEVIEGVLVVAPLSAELDEERTIGPLRDELLSLFERPYPRRVVVNLTHVAHLTGRAIGVLLAHHLKLESDGGALRICQPNPRVAVVLEQAKFAMLVECHASLDDAVLSHWAGATEDVGRFAV